MNQEEYPHTKYFDWSDLKTHLQSVKVPIDRDIRTYPTPIAGWDGLFNFLLEERTKISKELIRLEKLSDQSLEAGEKMRAIDEFVRSSEFLGGDAP
jgi:hypothetical protein